MRTFFEGADCRMCHVFMTEDLTTNIFNKQFPKRTPDYVKKFKKKNINATNEMQYIKKPHPNG